MDNPPEIGESEKIQVHDKVLAHLSRGLYRSPASALRELVSNSWDANATRVDISTNNPMFQSVAVRDNGDGFDRDAFVQHMMGDIGNSTKREQSQQLINNRPIIGRLGIGLLGIAQICSAFVVASKPKYGEPFQARVVLEDYIKDRLDQPESDLVEQHGDGEVIDIGRFTMEEPTLTINGTGTVVVATEVHQTFAVAFQASVKQTGFEIPRRTWKECVALLSKYRSLQELGDYWRLLWELSASCPIPYLSQDSLPDGLVASDQKRLESYGFSVHVDGLQLFKPVDLHGNEGGYTSTAIGPIEQTVYKKPLKFHGYICGQEGTQLRPDELRGLMIRLKNVGIGYYDGTLLDYRINEGPRSRWITGEIYVEQGLENALNIDRDSFNRFDPEFRALQQYIHRLLKEEIFSAMYRNIQVRSNAREAWRSSSRTEHLAATLEEKLDKTIEIRTNRDDNGMEQPEISISDDAISVTLPKASSSCDYKVEVDYKVPSLTIKWLSMFVSGPSG